MAVDGFLFTAREVEIGSKVRARNFVSAGSRTIHGTNGPGGRKILKTSHPDV